MMPAQAVSQVAQFLRMLADTDRELFIDTVETATSPIEIWTLATVLGYTGSMGDLIAWANELYPRTDRRKVLLAEADKLKTDIANARALIASEALDAKEGYSRIAFLSRELRGHLTEVDKMARTLDRRGLMMAGADRVMRELRTIFAGSVDMESALAQAFKAVWAVLIDER
jgi:hypothetical protein